MFTATTPFSKCRQFVEWKSLPLPCCHVFELLPASPLNSFLPWPTLLFPKSKCRCAPSTRSSQDLLDPDISFSHGPLSLEIPFSKCRLSFQNKFFPLPTHHFKFSLPIEPLDGQGDRGIKEFARTEGLVKIKFWGNLELGQSLKKDSVPLDDGIYMGKCFSPLYFQSVISIHHPSSTLTSAILPPLFSI